MERSWAEGTARELANLAYTPRLAQITRNGALVWAAFDDELPQCAGYGDTSEEAIADLYQSRLQAIIAELQSLVP